MRSRLRDRMKTRTLRPPAPWWPAWPPVTSFVGDRWPRAISFFSVAVTRPPLRFGRDTSPWFAPSPSKPLRGFQGAGRSRPAVETVRPGAPETRVKRSSSRSSMSCYDGAGRFAYSTTGMACIGVPPLSPLPAFPRRLGDALQRGRIRICSRDMNSGDTIFTCRE